MNIDIKSNKRKNILYRFVRLFIPVIGIILIVFGLYFNWQIKKEKEIVSIKQKNEVRVLKSIIDEMLYDVVSDLIFLSNSNSVNNYFQTFQNKKGDELIETFVNFSESKRIYDQIRLLDIKGMEILRVNADNNGNADIIDEKQLQDKSDRYYIKSGLNLNKGQIYISPIDLNIENGRIQNPINQVIRFVAPVFSDSGEKKGVIVLNYKAQDILNLVELFIKNNKDLNIMLLNNDGYWIKSDNIEKDFAFMYEDKKDISFKNEFKYLWNSIVSSKQGTIYNNDIIYYYNTINPLHSFEKKESNY
ncbi:cache domain-containing protein [Tepidibacter aestuarii]|uniref:cache domain-containing protein n=1 Tax=Tepidibacter aestuarii TaxID=2925782 RepID=UPI0020C02EFD|nr:cache domain-containing protein [Tepidibacter aestuarii]CAH2212146.1 protein of unknown function [Tepidibacter aestuarii]